MRIREIELSGRALLAPMAGVTDSSFRRICRDMGAALTVTEMVSSRAIQYSYQKTVELADLSRDRAPVFLQLFGDDPVIMALAAKKAMGFKPDGIDINMGCPVPKVAGNNCGSALMKSPDLCGRIVAAVKSAVDIPVTVKMRKGFTEENVNAVEVALACEEAGADAVCVHGRTRPQMYSGKVDWEIIRKVKESVKIPVIGNGDVAGAQEAAKLIACTGCDLVMVGRAALGNPWVFREINAYLRDETIVIPPPGINERLLMMKKNIDMMVEEKGEARAMKEARKVAGWYCKGLAGAAELRRIAGGLSSYADLAELIKHAYELESMSARTK